jgi:hypothetical protein
MVEENSMARITNREAERVWNPIIPFKGMP